MSAVLGPIQAFPKKVGAEAGRVAEKVKGAFEAPELPPLQPEITDNNEAVQEAAKVEADKLRKRRGFQSTIVTGPQGVPGNAPGSRSTLA